MIDVFMRAGGTCRFGLRCDCCEGLGHHRVWHHMRKVPVPVADVAREVRRVRRAGRRLGWGRYGVEDLCRECRRAMAALDAEDAEDAAQ